MEAAELGEAPEPAEVRRIAAMHDAVLRNLEITHCYWRLAQAVASRTGVGAKWCTFATWASQQARGPIRGEVFEEIGLEFARYVHDCPPDAADIQPFLDSLAPGEPPDGQQFLRQAFQRYQRLSVEPDADARAQLLLTANLEIGLHEQTRLQPEILEALDAAYAGQGDLGRRILDALLPHDTRARAATPDTAAAAVLGVTARRIERHGAEIARGVITRSLMVLSMPGRVLWLGAHLADPYPEALQAITNEDLEVLVTRFEPVAPAADDCGAHDWSVLRQRMHYILHLFRSWHEHPELASRPFTPSQLASISAGVIPDGDL